jgi:hypothetical protein
MAEPLSEDESGWFKRLDWRRMVSLASLADS